MYKKNKKFLMAKIAVTILNNKLNTTRPEMLRFTKLTNAFDIVIHLQIAEHDKCCFSLEPTL